MIKDNIYYINIKNEIYECKFNHLIGSVSDRRVSDFAEHKFPINTIILNIAGIGEKKWYHHLGCDFFSPCQIYTSVEDAMDATNPIFKFYGGNLMGVNNIWFRSLPDPENGNWECKYDCLGVQVFIPTCWEWDGFKAIKTKIQSPNECELLKVNSYLSLNFDFATQEYLYNSAQKFWKTEEECKKANSIKVHRF